MGALIFSVLVLEVLTWAWHVNPKPIISPPFPLLLPAVLVTVLWGTVPDGHGGAQPRCGSSSPAARPKAVLSLSFSADPGALAGRGRFPSQAFSCFSVLHRTPAGEEGIASRSVPVLAGICS